MSRKGKSRQRKRRKERREKNVVIKEAPEEDKGLEIEFPIWSRSYRMVVDDEDLE